MKKLHLLIIIPFIFINYIVNIQAQTTFENHIVVKGDTIYLEINNYTVGDIQWQAKDSLFGMWEDLYGETDKKLSLYFTGSVSYEKYFRAILFNNPEGKNLITDAIKVQFKENASEISVGDIYGGGQVFLNQDSFVYIVAEPSMLAPWGCVGQEIKGADGKNIGDGVQNTKDIIENCKEDSTAAWLCDNLVYKGFEDWYLPSIGEVEKMTIFFLDKDINVFNGAEDKYVCMSSTEANPYNFYAISLFKGFEITLSRKDHLIFNFIKFIRRQHYLRNISDSIPLDFKLSSETEQILISFPDSTKSLVKVFFQGLTNPGDELQWNFAGGEVIEGENIGPYIIGYDNGDFLTINLTLFKQSDTLTFESEEFRPKLFKKNPIELPRFYFGTTSIADFDNDGYEDFLVSGNDTTQLYFNLDGVDFYPVDSPFPNLRNSFSDVGDYNNDGYSDVIISGFNRSDSLYMTKLYQNIEGKEWEEQVMEIPGLIFGFVKWVDFNRDGYLDFLISGEMMDSTAYTGLFKGNGLGTFEKVITPFENLANSTGAFGDYNNDNFLDLIISGSRDSVRYAHLYKNENGEFIETSIPIIPVNYGTATWADYNNDGRLDFSISGNKEEIFITGYKPDGSPTGYNNFNAVSFYHYLNISNDNFKKYSNGTLGQHYINSSHKSADIDFDGKQDVIIAGQSAIIKAYGGNGGSGSGISKFIERDLRNSKIVLYKNNSSENNLVFDDRRAHIPSFVDFINAVSERLRCKSVSFFDYNNDGKTDILRGGATSYFPTAIYSNTIYRDNTPPLAPQNLKHEILSCDSIYLHWDYSSDDNTPDIALSYDIYLGTSPGFGDILSIANDDQLQNNWFRLNKPLENGTYYWSVRAMDGSLIFGKWALESSFTIGVPTPTITFDGTYLISDVDEGNQWYNESGLIPGGTESTFKPIEDGNYFCIVTDSTGCISDSSNVIKIELTKTIEKSIQNVLLFPVPTSDFFTIQGIERIKGIQIYDISGRLQKSINYKKQNKISIIELNPGIYIVRIITENNSFLGKVVKY